MTRDFTSEELTALDLLHKAHPIHYGKIILEVSFEDGKRTYTRIVREEGITEKFRGRNGPAPRPP